MEVIHLLAYGSMKKNAIILALVATLCSCNFALYRNHFQKEWQAGRFQANYTNNIDEMLNIQGYYAPDPYDGDSTDSRRAFIFYPDGTYGIGVFLPQSYNLYRKPGINLLENIYHDEKYYCSGGYYSIKGDTIEADEYALYMMSWEIWEKLCFKIIDKNTLLVFQQSDDVGSMDSLRTFPRHHVLRYVPTNSIPPATGVYAKKKKWMWHDKKEWKQYKRSLK